MRSTRGLFASIVFLLALPVAALYQMLLATGVEAVLHGALALGALLMAFAVFDFKAPRWAAWVAAGSTGLLAGIFLLQGVSELVHDESLTSLAYQSMGQRLEGWLVDVFMAWCVAVLVVDTRAAARGVGIVAMATVACVKAYAHVLAWRGTSLDAQAPILKVLLLMPFVWLLFESTRRASRDAVEAEVASRRGGAEVQ
jgi:hypothetical protein